MNLEEAAERIAGSLEAGIAPWSRSTRLRFTCGLPIDAASGRPIRGLNAWLLELAAIERGYRNRFWATRGQWECLGGAVVRGDGTPVIGDGERPGGWSVLYSVEQVESRRGPAAALGRFRVARETIPDYDLAQRLLDATGARVVTSDRCYCVVCSDPSRDFIAMQPLDPVGGDTDRWWSALFHELTHWSAEGLGRVGWRGDYNHCELIAEIGSATLTNHCGISKRGGIPADAEMVGDWIGGIRENIGYLTLACAVAELAVSYVLDQGKREGGA